MIALLAAAALTVQGPQRVATRQSLVSRLDSLVEARLPGLNTSSAAVAVVRGGEPILLKGYGLADREHHRVATPNTIYEIGSITKQFTAAAVLKLVEQGKLRLDDDIAKYVNFPLQGHRVLVRQLLNHTSGIHNYTGVRAWQRTWADDLTPDSLLGFVKTTPFDFAPGERNSYSNTGYILLGMIIEKASGEPYARFLQDELFTPLNLAHTGYCANHPNDPMVATGYSPQGDTLGPAPYLSMTHPFAAGALCSTVVDLAAWELALHTGKVLSPVSFQRMTHSDTLNNGERINYGYGLGLGTLAGYPATTHNGGINGFTSAEVYVPAESLAVVVLINTDARTPETLTLDLARVVLGVAPTGYGLLDAPGRGRQH